MNILAALALHLAVLHCGGPASLAAPYVVRLSDQQPEASNVTQAPAAASAPAIDPAHEASIRKLLDLTGASALMQQTMAKTSDSLRPLLLSSLPAGDYREELVGLFFKKFQSKIDTRDLIGLVVSIYAKHLTKDEVDGLVQFYQTPLGQKAISVLPQVVSEAQDAGRKWGERLGRDSMAEVLNEHPDLRKALVEAAGGAKK